MLLRRSLLHYLLLLMLDGLLLHDLLLMLLRRSLLHYGVRCSLRVSPEKPSYF
jgi:hypothetical protein